MRIALLISLLSLPALAEELAEVDKPAPQFRLPVYNAKEFGESFVALDALVGDARTDQDGKLLVVSFMASFCGPCKKEMPYLQKLYAENRDKGLRVMMVAIDSDEDGQKKVEALVAENHVTFPVAKDRFNIVARRWLGAHVLIHSAPFGPVGALDPIPAYRLAAGTSLPGIRPLRRHWAEPTSAALQGSGFLLDMRSEAYVALGPIPDAVPSAYVRVVTPTGRALNHFNKKAKGELVRMLAERRPGIGSIGALLRWAARAGVTMRTSEPGVVELVVDD